MYNWQLIILEKSKSNTNYNNDNKRTEIKTN